METRHEFFHAPGDGEFWSESHYLDVVGDGVAAHARIGFYPNQDAANVFAYLLEGTGPDATVYRLREDEGDPRHVHGLNVDAPDNGWVVTGRSRSVAPPRAARARARSSRGRANQSRSMWN